MNTMLLMLVLQMPAKPSIEQVRARTIAIERKLDRAIAEKAQADSKARTRELSLIRSRQGRNEKKIAENHKRISLLEAKIRRIALAKRKTVTLVRYLPARNASGAMTKIARKPLARARTAMYGPKLVRPPAKKPVHLSWLERIFAWPGRSGRVASMKNSWD